MSRYGIDKREDGLWRVKRRVHGPERVCALCQISEENQAGVLVLRFQIIHGVAVGKKRTTIGFGTVAFCEDCMKQLGIRRHRNRKDGHCLRGHPFDAENTYIIPSTGRRQCRTCQEDRRVERIVRARRERGAA